MAITQTPPDRIKSRAMQLVEHRIGEPIEPALHRLYVVERKTQAEVAEALGVTRRTVIRWMQDFGIETRWLGPRA
jgi:CRP-like cAMP-binding protein